MNKADFCLKIKAILLKFQTNNMQEEYEAMGKELTHAAGIHDLSKVKQLVKKGADINYISYTNSNNWYRGDSQTPLSSAITNPFTHPTNYLNLITYLLQNGANLNFQTVKGIFQNKPLIYKIKQKIAQQISKFNNENEKIQLLKILIEYGLNINHVQIIVDQRYLLYRKEEESYCMKLVGWNGVGSRMGELEDMLSWRVDKWKQGDNMKQEISNVIRSQPTNDKSSQNHGNKVQQQNTFIDFLIQAGMDPNCYRSTLCRKNNRQSGHQIYKMPTIEDYTYENIMHCAISNNNLPLVTKLLHHNSTITTKCTITITIPFHPSQWPPQLQQQQQNKNKQKIKRLQQHKSILKDNINKYVPQINKYITFSQIQSIQRQISELKKYSLENAVPIGVRQRRQVDCLELAEYFGVDREIVRVIENAMREQNGVNTENGGKIKQVEINQ